MISISTLKKILSRQDGREQLLTPEQETADFRLQYRDLEIGLLSLHDGKWHFAYTDDFRSQKGVPPLTDFPDLDKHYESEALWPFFAVRIPGLGQPAVQRVIDREDLDKRNEAQLLKRFGKTTIANPFVLVLLQKDKI